MKSISLLGHAQIVQTPEVERGAPAERAEYAIALRQQEPA